MASPADYFPPPEAIVTQASRFAHSQLILGTGHLGAFNPFAAAQLPRLLKPERSYRTGSGSGGMLPFRARFSDDAVRQTAAYYRGSMNSGLALDLGWERGSKVETDEWIGALSE